MRALDQDGATFTNETAETGNPAVTITGDDVTFINRRGASVVGSPAIQIRGAGATIINEAGALIRGAAEWVAGYAYVAIDGSEFGDTVINYGRIVNDINLNGGNDRYEVYVTAENNVMGNPVANLGSGDDRAVFHLAGVSDLRGVDTEGGAGYDTLEFDGIGSVFIEPNVLTGFERIRFTGTGSSSYVSITRLSGAQEIVLSAGLTLSLGNGPQTGSNPAAKVYLEGGNFVLNATHTAGEIIGSSAAERAEVRGALTGGVSMGGGDDRLEVEASIGGSVSLGDGDDVFDADGTTVFVGTASGTSIEYRHAGTVAGSIDGGAGNDKISLFATDGRTVRLSGFTGFESAVVTGAIKGDIRVTGGEAVQSLVLSVNADLRFSIGETTAPGLGLVLSVQRAEIVIESTTTIAGITRAVPIDNGAFGRDPTKNLVVRNEGTILGDVHLWTGDDLFDGRMGSVGGVVSGLAGNDTILLGAGNDIAHGGEGDDIIEGNGGADNISGGSGSDTLRGGAGADTLDGGSGDDRIFGGDGNDVLIDTDGVADALFGGSGDDVITLVRTQGALGTFTVDGGEGDDGIRIDTGYGTKSHVDIDAGAGADRIAVEQLAGTAYIRLGAGADTLFMDTFIANSLRGTIRVVDFAAGAGGDRLDLANRPLLREAFFTWDGSSDLFAAGVLRLVQRGSEVYLEGTVYSASDWTTILIFTNADARNFTAANFSGHQPVIADVAETHAGTAGADAFAGGAGDDIYLVNHPGDTVTEWTNENDEVRTSLSSYRLPAYVERLTGTSGAAQDLRGNFADNVVFAGPGGDLIRLNDGGIDVVNAGAGNDAMVFGGTLTAADLVDGGEGADILAIQGNYAAGLTLGAGNLVSVETLSLLSGADNRFGDPGGNLYSYKLTSVDANVAAGSQLKVNGAQLLAGENLTFDGSAETDGTFFIYGGMGVDTLTGGSGADVFFFAEGRLNPGDRFDGRGGNDIVVLRGNFSGSNAAVFAADTIVGVETVSLLSAADTRFFSGGNTYSYNFTTHDGNVAAGMRLTVNAGKLGTGETLTFDGSAERDGFFSLFGGAGADSLKGGAGSDLLYGGHGADLLRGNGGADTFRYQTADESTALARDTIEGFTAGIDKIDLGRIDANSANGPGNDAFSFIGAEAFGGVAGQLRVVQNGATWLVEGDVDGDGKADLVVEVSTDGTQPLTANDFFF